MHLEATTHPVDELVLAAFGRGFAGIVDDAQTDALIHQRFNRLEAITLQQRVPAAAIVSIILFAVLILAIAAYLVRVIMVLNHVNDQLGKITFGVRAIAHQTKPINELTESMGANLGAISGALGDLVADVSHVEEPAA